MTYGISELMTSDRRTDGRTHKQLYRPTYVVRTWVNDVCNREKSGEKFRHFTLSMNPVYIAYIFYDIDINEYSVDIL